MDLEQHLRETLSATYRVERELGGGGMSRVFVAEETSLGRRVALKVLTELGEGVSVDRFRREIQTVANLQHPHIVPLLNAGSAGTTVYYTMPLVEGESLRARLGRESRLRVREAVQITRDIAEALAYAHRRGVIHRDIKPDNVLLTDGHAVVTDFGVAKALFASADEGTLTAAGLAIGTPAYMAPEQVLADADADHRMDLYALGCVLYEMLAGKPPVTGATIREVMTAQVARTPDDVTGLRADVPADVAAWLRRALAKSPDERWATADEALADLDACFAKLSGERAAMSRTAGMRRRTMWLVGAVIVLAVAAGAIAMLRRGAGSAAYDPDRIAVMPFIPTDPADTALARLGRDLVVTLTANLDDVGDLRMIDPLSILAQTEPGEPRDPDRAVAIAAGMQAGSALVGTLVRAGTHVRLDYRLLPSSGNGDALAKGSVTAPLGEESILTLTDSATWKMLADILPARDQELPSFELLRTRSVPALRAFLEGENHLLANEWGAAEEAYARAIAEDSTFWFAYRRVWLAADWMFSAYRRAREDSIAWEHRSGFPERERLLMEYDRHETFAGRLAALADVTRRFPDYWYGWFEYGDYIVHNGTRIGLNPLAAEHAFDRTLELNPRLVPILDHRVVFLHDSARVEKAYAGLRAHYGDDWHTAVTYSGMSPAHMYDPFVSVARHGHVEATVLDSLASGLAHDRIVDVFAEWGGAWPALALDPQGELKLAGLAAAQGAAPALLARTRQWDATAWAMRGDWDSALVAIDRTLAAEPDLRLAVVRYAFGVMALQVGAAERPAALERRPDPAAFGASPALLATANRQLAFLDGMVAHAEGDAAGINAARERLRDLSGDEYAAFLEREMGAFRLELDGHRDEAADSLVAIEWERGNANRFDYYIVPFIRLAAGRWKAEAGQAATADSLLAYYESGTTDLTAQLLLKQTAPLAALERARAWDQAGNAERATHFYREFLRMYDLPPAQHRPYVEEAKAALVRLAGS